MKRKKYQRGGQVRGTYGAPLSGYVDYGFEKVGEVRRNRYLDNFLTSQSVVDLAGQLQVAPLPVDQQIRQNLLSATDQAMQAIADKGDYENLTVAVNNLASQFRTRSQALTQNKTQYEQFKKTLDDEVARGKLDAELYQGTLDLATAYHNESGGMQIDEKGRGRNFFKPISVVQTPKIPEMIKDALVGIIPNAKQVSYQGPMKPSDPNYGIYWVQTINGWEKVSPDRVDAAMEMVMQDPRVQTYFDRISDIRTHFLDDEGILTTFKDLIEERQMRIQDIDRQIAEAPNSREGRSNVEALNQNKEGHIRQIGAIQQLLETGNPQELKEAAKLGVMQGLDDLYRFSAKARYSFEQEQYSRSLDYDKAFLKSLESKGVTDPTTVVGFSGDVTQYESPSGKTMEDKFRYQNSLNEQRESYQQPTYFDNRLGTNELTGESFTYDEVLNMSPAEFQVSQGGKATEAQMASFNKVQNEILEVETRIGVIDEVNRSANAETNTDMTTIINNTYDNVPGAVEFVNAIRQKKSMSEQQAFDRMVSYTDHLLNQEESRAAVQQNPGLVGAVTPQLPISQFSLQEAEELDNMWADISNEHGFSSSGFTNQARQIHSSLEEARAARDKWLEERFVRTGTGGLYDNLPGMSEDELRQVKNFVLGATPNQMGVAFIDPDNGSLIAFDELISKPEFGLTDGLLGMGGEQRQALGRAVAVDKIRFNPAHPGIHGPTMEMQFKFDLEGGGSATIPGKVPLSMLDASAAAKYLGSQSNKFVRSAIAQYSQGLNTPKVVVRYPSGEDIVFEVRFSATDPKTVIPLNGPQQGKPQDYDVFINQFMPLIEGAGGAVVPTQYTTE